jgi:hypothetical protein
MIKVVWVSITMQYNTMSVISPSCLHRWNHWIPQQQWVYPCQHRIHKKWYQSSMQIIKFNTSNKYIILLPHIFVNIHNAHFIAVSQISGITRYLQFLKSLAQIIGITRLSQFHSFLSLPFNDGFTDHWHYQLSLE